MSLTRDRRWPLACTLHVDALVGVQTRRQDRPGGRRCRASAQEAEAADGPAHIRPAPALWVTDADGPGVRGSPCPETGGRPETLLKKVLS